MAGDKLLNHLRTEKVQFQASTTYMVLACTALTPQVPCVSLSLCYLSLHSWQWDLFPFYSYNETTSLFLVIQEKLTLLWSKTPQSLGGVLFSRVLGHFWIMQSTTAQRSALRWSVPVPVVHDCFFWPFPMGHASNKKNIVVTPSP